MTECFDCDKIGGLCQNHLDELMNETEEGSMPKRIPITDRDDFILKCANEPENVYYSPDSDNSIFKLDNYKDASIGKLLAEFNSSLNGNHFFYQPPIKTRKVARYYICYEKTSHADFRPLEKRDDGHYYCIDGNRCGADYFKRDGDYFNIDEDGKPV